MHLTVTLLLLERQLTSTVPSFISFSLPSAPGENKVDAVVSQMQSTPQWDSVQQTLILYLSQVMTSPRRSLTCNQSVQ